MMALDPSFLSSHQSLLDLDHLSFGFPDFHDIISSSKFKIFSFLILSPHFSLCHQFQVLLCFIFFYFCIFSHCWIECSVNNKLGMESSSCSDASIGYSQDAFANSSDNCKRRRKEFEFEFSALHEPNMADYEDLHYLFQVSSSLNIYP